MGRPYQRPVPGQREVHTPHHPGGGGADAAGARAHTHVTGTRGLPEGQPDRARRTHRPRGMAYQRARVRDTRTGRPATRSAEHAGREGGNAPEQYRGRTPHDPPVTTAPSGRAEGGYRSAGAPGGAVHGPPLTPPHPGAAPRPRPHAHAGGECADDARGARMEYRRPPPSRGGREAAARPPPPHPPRRPASRGGPGPDPPGQGGLVPPPRPRKEPERDPPPRPSRRLPQGPRRTSEPAPTRQDAAQIAPREGGRARTGVVWGATPPMDRTTPVTPALLPAQGRQRDRTRQSDPPPYRPLPGRTNGGSGARPPPPNPPPGTRTPRTRPAARSPQRACRLRGQRRAPTPARPRPQHVESGPQQPAQWTGSRGRGSA